MNCLVLSDTFPNRLEPWRGPYNRRQLECLSARCSITVINPIPLRRLLSGVGYWGLVSRPDHVLEGIPIHHPLFWYVPILGRGATWRGVLSAAERALRKGAAGEYDLVFATFAYPHGAAARALAKRLGIPYVVKARGSDLHAMPAQGGRRERTAAALHDAAAVVAVSGNLAEIAVELGAAPEKVHVLPNGIDAAAFRMLPRKEARERLGLPLDRKLLLFVGNLLVVKGLDVLMDAFIRLRSAEGAVGSDALLAVAGVGPMRRHIERCVSGAGLSAAVRLMGYLPRDEVVLWMNAADVLVLPSRNEGCPNVILEAFACGTPVVASDVGAVPNLVDAASGLRVEAGDPDALAHALGSALSRDWDRAGIRARVEGMSWQDNARTLLDILTKVVRD